MKRNKFLSNLSKVFYLIIITLLLSLQAKTQSLVPPAQDQGLPYTRSAQKFAVTKINCYFAVFAGSRYAWVKGCKVRLDETNWRDEAQKIDGVVYVPASFAGVLSLKEVKSDVAPSYLADRWVYTISRPTLKLDNMRKTEIDSRSYVAFADVAKAQGLKVYENPNGLVIAGNDLISFGPKEQELMLSVVTMFDTPEKYANPDIATQYVPTLKRQGKWTDYVKVTPEQMKKLEGPETKWVMTPTSEYNYSGFNTKLLGSKVPEPGIYPRILFSAEDIPMLAERIKKNKLGQMSMIEIESLFKKTWWDQSTSDGQVFEKLASGDLKGLEWPDLDEEASITNLPQQFKNQKPGIYNSHVAYVPECLTNMALFCLMTNDNVHGRKAAAAIANYFKLREPLIDEFNRVSDSEFGSTYIRPNGKSSNNNGNNSSTQWRNMHGVVAHMNLGLALDFGGKWMTTEEKDLMRRVIAKATYGRRAYSQDGSIRFRDINWASWDLPNFLALAAIEGLEGFDREAFQSNCETVKAFCEWGIDDSGVIYESNGKTPGGSQFHTLSMITLARRGENLWGHPHVRKLLEGQIQMTSPSGKVVVNSGTQYVPNSRQHFSPQVIDEYKAFYPENSCADYLLTEFIKNDDSEETRRFWTADNFNPATYPLEIEKIKRLRMSSPTYPGFVRSFLYDTDFKPTTRAELKLPLDFNAPTHGVFSAYSDNSTEATWIDMMVRPDHYLGAGHHHADAGMFHFSALGVDWITESPFPQVYNGKYHNQVLVDSISEPDGISGLGTGYQAPAKYLGTTINQKVSFAAADLTNSYSYRWQTQPDPILSDKYKALKWEMDPSAENLKTFAGTARYKMRPWWATSNYSNYMATSRSLYNPMQYVYRSVGLVRGEHSYGILMDDLKKDELIHLYQWTAMLNGGVWEAKVKGLDKGQVVLAFRKQEDKNNEDKSLINPSKGEPLLLVCSLSELESNNTKLPLMQVSSEVGPNDKKGNPQTYDRFAINAKAKAVNFRVLLIPFKYGEALPKIKTESGKVTIEWADQKDLLRFDIKENRTSVKVDRDGKTIAESK